MDHIELNQLRPELAKKRFRVFAAFADYFIFSCLFIGYCFLFGTKSTDSSGVTEYSVNGFPALGLFLIWVVLFPLLESFGGQTLGKKMLHIKVVQLDHHEVNFGLCLVRHLFDAIDFFMFGLVGLLVASNNANKQRVGDLVAKTIVIQKV